jgi:hypothetical protein
MNDIRISFQNEKGIINKITIIEDLNTKKGEKVKRE